MSTYNDMPLIHLSGDITVPSKETVVYTFDFNPHAYSSSDIGGIAYIDINGIWSNISNDLGQNNNTIYSLTSGEPIDNDVRFDAQNDGNTITITIYNNKWYDIGCRLFISYFGLRRQITRESVAYQILNNCKVNTDYYDTDGNSQTELHHVDNILWHGEYRGHNWSSPNINNGTWNLNTNQWQNKFLCFRMDDDTVLTFKISANNDIVIWFDKSSYDPFSFSEPLNSEFWILNECPCCCSAEYKNLGTPTWGVDGGYTTIQDTQYGYTLAPWGVNDQVGKYICFKYDSSDTYIACEIYENTSDTISFIPPATWQSLDTIDTDNFWIKPNSLCCDTNHKCFHKLTTSWKVKGHSATLLTSAHKVQGLISDGNLRLTAAWKVSGPLGKKLTTAYHVAFKKMIQRSTVSYHIASKQVTKLTSAYKVSNTNQFKTTSAHKVLGIKVSDSSRLTTSWKVLGPLITKLPVGYKVANPVDPIRLTVSYKVANTFSTILTTAYKINSHKGVMFKGIVLDSNDQSKTQQYNLGKYLERFDICNDSIIAVGFGTPQVWSNDVTPVQYTEDVDYIWDEETHTITRIGVGSIGIAESVDIIYGLNQEYSDDNIIIADNNYVPGIGVPTLEQLDGTSLTDGVEYTWNSETFTITRLGVAITAIEHVIITYGPANEYEDTAIITYGHRLNHAPKFYNVELFSEDGFFLKNGVDYNYNLNSGNIEFTTSGLNAWCE